MAVTNDVWRHDGDNSWNDLIRRVNDLLQTPDSGCDPIAPLPEVDEGHKWTVDDISDMQDKLKEVCKDNVFTTIENGDKWEKFIIDELEDALAAGWCDCEECVPSCDNAGPVEEIFLLSVTVDQCKNSDQISSNCNEEASNSVVLYDEYLTLKDLFQTSYRELCVLEDEVAELESQKDAACTVDPESQSCLDLTDELEDKEAERDAQANLAEADKQAMLGKAAETVSNAGAATSPDGGGPLINLVSGTHPWTNWECDDPLRIPTCAGFNIDECLVLWSVQRRVIEGTCENFDCSTFDCGGFPTDWINRLTGEYTVDGSPVVRPFGGCVEVSGGIQCAKSDCSDPPPNGCEQPCSGLTQVSSTVEYRLRKSFPPDNEPFTCNTGQPCTP